MRTEPRPEKPRQTRAVRSAERRLDADRVVRVSIGMVSRAHQSVRPCGVTGPMSLLMRSSQDVRAAPRA
jgi:hypothetical protein